MRRLTAFLLAFATALIMPMGIDTAQTPPPASGDWEISDYTYIADSEVILNGNLTVKSGGKLELDNTILRMNCTTDGQYAIRVEKNGELVIKNGSLLTDWLTLYELGHYFKFVVWGKMAIQDSHIWRTTQNYYPGSIGIEINSDDVSIVNSSMEGHCEIGILINESNMQFLGSQTWRNKVGIYCRGFSHPTIADGWINGNEIGILVNDYSTPSIINNSFYNINISIANRMASFAFIERNFFSSQFGRGGIGISNEHFSSALVKNNTISNLTTGISNSNMSRPKITGNHIVANSFVGIHNLENSTPVIKYNTISNNAGTGIINAGSANITIENNTLSGNCADGILNEGKASYTISNNTIMNCTPNGIINRGNTCVTIMNNTMSGNAAAGITGLGTSSLLVLCNNLSNGPGCAISAFENSSIVSEDNVLWENHCGIEVYNDKGNLSNNSIFGGEYGIKIHNCSPVLSNNYISGATCGIQFSRTNATVLNTNLSRVAKCAIYCNDSASPSIVNSSITSTVDGWDFHISEDSHPTTVNSTFNQSSVKIEDSSSLCVKWYLGLSVKDSKSRPLDSASVLIEGKERFSSITDSDGSIPGILLEDRTQKKSGSVKPSYNITIERNGDANRYLGMTVNRSETRELLFDFAPIINPMEVFIDENSPSSLDLSKNYYDPDNEISELTPSLINGSELNKNVRLNGTTLELNYSLPVEDAIFIDVSDGTRDAFSKIPVHVRPKNDAPIVQDIPGLWLDEDIPYSTDISPFISDEEDPVTSLSVRIDSPYANVKGRNITFCYPEGIYEDIVDVIIEDDDGASTLAKIRININPFNDQPFLRQWPKIQPVEDIELVVDFSGYIEDSDSPPGDYIINTSSLYCTVDGLKLRFRYPDGVIKEHFQINISDGLDCTLYDMDINITPVNDPPTMATPAITVIAGRPARQDMWDLLSDIDTPRERLRLSTTSPYVTIRDFNITFMYPSDMGSGYDTVRLELSDGTDTTSVDLTVNVTAQKTTVKFTEKYAVYLYMAIPLAVVGTVAGLIAYRRYRYGWYEMKRAMVVNHDGRMLAHVGESAQGDDEMLVSSMLTAVQQFIEEAMKKEKAGSIKEFQYEDMKIAVERGARIYLAVFLKGYVTDVLRNDMKELVGMIEAKYEKELVDWDGMMTKTGFIIEAAEQLMNLSRKK